ncbi:AAA family ATPase [Pseudomonas sp. zbq_11]|uniref:AAA family ATPase n=1 Tax=unclassified Pseudomonas TaxID=196821 RepID=UPI00370C2471
MNNKLKLVHEKFGVRNIIKHAQMKADYLFEGLIERGDQWIISGAPKSGKSRLALQLAIAASEGIEFLGYKCPRKLRVLYFDLELSARVSSSRIYASYNFEADALLKNTQLFVCSDYKQIDVNSTSDCTMLEELIELIDPDLIVWDVLARMHVADENSNIAMLQVMQNVRRLSRGIAHVIVHHARKEKYGNGGAKSIRGASSIHGEADGVMSLALENARKGTHSLMFSTRAVETPDKLWLNGQGLIFAPACTNQGEADSRTPREFLESIFDNQKTLKRADLLEKVEINTNLGLRQIERKLNEYIESGLLSKARVGREVFYEIRI